MKVKLFAWGLLAALIYLLSAWLAHRYPQPAPSADPAPAQPKPAEKIPLYLFTQDGCLPCAQMHKSLQDPKVQKELERFELSEVYPGDQKYRVYGVNGTPTLVALSESAGPVKKVGYLPPRELLKWLQGIK